MNALEIFTKDASLTYYLEAMTGLAENYVIKSQVENRKENLEKAIAKCNDIIELLDRHRSSPYYGKAQYILLLSYLGLSDFENKEVNLNKALIANREAVSVFEEGNLVFDKSIALAAGANILS